jgi:hypothetical protein
MMARFLFSSPTMMKELVMSDTPKGSFQLAGEGTAPTASPASVPQSPEGGEPQAGNPPAYITEERLNQILADRDRRLGQSISDKTADRVRKIVEAARQAGEEVTPEQVNAILTQPPKTSTPASAAAPAQVQPQEQGTAKDPVAIARAKLLKEGIDPDSVTPEDPDFKLINWDTDDAVEFLASIPAYIAAHKERQGNPARIPSLSSGGTGAAGGKAAITRELEGLMKNPARNAVKIKELSAQLAKFN